MRSLASALSRPLGLLAVAALAAWPVALLALSVLDYVLPHRGDPAPHIDLEVYRAAASALLEGESLYAGTFTVGPLAAELPFTYPPVAAVLLVPTTLLSVVDLGVVWTVASYLLLAGTIYGVARSMGERRLIAFMVALFGTGVGAWFGPMRSHLSLGQVNVLLMALVATDVLARRPRFPRGALIGLAAAVKLTPAAFILVFIVRRDWQAAFVAAASALAWTALGAAVVWQDSMGYWSTLLESGGRVRVFAEEHNYSLHGIIERLPLGPAALPLAVLAAALVVAVGVLAISRQLADGQLAAALVANAIIIALVSPISWPHHWVWAVPAAVILALAAVRGSRLAAAAAVVTLAAFLVTGAAGSSQRFLWIAYTLWGLTALLVLCVSLRPDERLPRWGGSP